MYHHDMGGCAGCDDRAVLGGRSGRAGQPRRLCRIDCRAGRGGHSRGHYTRRSATGLVDGRQRPARRRRAAWGSPVGSDADRKSGPIPIVERQPKREPLDPEPPALFCTPNMEKLNIQFFL